MVAVAVVDVPFSPVLQLDLGVVQSQAELSLLLFGVVRGLIVVALVVGAVLARGRGRESARAWRRGLGEGPRVAVVLRHGLRVDLVFLDVGVDGLQSLHSGLEPGLT